MTTTGNGFGSAFQAHGNSAPAERFKSPMAKAAQQGSAEAMEFQLWVSKQATSLAKLKVFHTMAKQVNDQQ